MLVSTAACRLSLSLSPTHLALTRSRNIATYLAELSTVGTIFTTAATIIGGIGGVWAYKQVVRFYSLHPSQSIIVSIPLIKYTIESYITWTPSTYSQQTPSEPTQYFHVTLLILSSQPREKQKTYTQNVMATIQKPYVPVMQKLYGLAFHRGDWEQEFKKMASNKMYVLYHGPSEVCKRGEKREG